MTDRNTPEWLEELKSKWPSSVVARSEIGRFTGGLIGPRTMANIDCRGVGPANRIRMGDRTIGYPLKDLISWMAVRIKQVEEPKHDHAKNNSGAI